MLRKVAIVVAALLAVLPLWSVKYPPIQDLPLHMAAVRVIHSLNDFDFGFATDFQLTIGRTQYLLYYLGGSALSYVLGVRGASLAMVSFYLGGTVLATRSLCVALGKDERASLFSLPLLFNCSLVIGFLPFLIAIPLLLWALAASVRFLDAPTRLRGAVVGVLAVLVFGSHPLPFVFFVLGYGALWLVAAWRRRTVRAAAVRLVPLVPAFAAFTYWLFGTAAGKVSLNVVTASETGDPPWPFNQVFSDTYKLAFDVFTDTSDETVMLLLVGALIVAAGLAQGDRETRAPSAARVLWLLPLAALVMFLRSGHRVGYVAHIKDRFPILFVFTAVPVLARVPRGARGWFVTACALGVGAFASYNVIDHFRRFDREEVGSFDEALAAVPPRNYVAWMSFLPTSSIVTQHPFLHFGAYYQVDKGGIVQFSFAGYPHWPFAYKEGREIPPGGAGEGWAWSPETIDVQRDLFPYFTYVLERGHGFTPPPSTYHRIYRDALWEVWKRD